MWRWAESRTVGQAGVIHRYSGAVKKLRSEDLAHYPEMRAWVKVQESEVKEIPVWGKTRSKGPQVSTRVKSCESNVQEIQAKGETRGENLFPKEGSK